MQLVAYGAQDIYLTGNPQITFFKVVYRRHTNFAMEAIAQTFDGQVSSGCTVSATISRNGDLVHRVYLEVDNSNGVMNAFALVDQVDLEIGGQLIDRHYGKWMAVWCELTHSTSKHEQLDMLIDADKGTGTTRDDPDAGAQDRVWIPLQFSFCRNPGLAIPLIALQYHEVKLNVKFGTLPTNANVCMFCDYIYLDTDERRRFAQTSHEYLIEQVQSSLSNCTTAGCVQKVTLHFNHPVKELIWMEDKGNWASGSRDVWTEEKSGNMLLRLNGHERFTARDATYFSKVQRYQHHTGAHAVPYEDTGKYNHLYVYSFALQPEEHQPSGTCNFSRIDNAVLELTGDCDIYAVNYNVLRVMSGMGGLAYSN